MALHSIELCAGVGMLGEGARAAFDFLGIEHRTVCYVEREAPAAAQLARLMEAGAAARIVGLERGGRVKFSLGGHIVGCQGRGDDSRQVFPFTRSMERKPPRPSSAPSNPSK